ncbi:MAG: vanadium-dependent haloperoxidase [Bacteroidota bacterium]
MKQWLILALYVIGLTACDRTKSNSAELPGVALQEACNEAITQVIVHDIFTPPVASRIYAYSNLAFYEAHRIDSENHRSLLPELKGFDSLPIPADRQAIDPRYAATKACLQVAEALIFSMDSLRKSLSKIELSFSDLSDSKRKASQVWADSVSALILRRAATDNYRLTRGMPRYSSFGETGKWQQTPPEYADATEPNWKRIIPLLMDSAGQFKADPPPPYNVTPGSLYYQELKEVIDVSKAISPEQDTIAQYWDDNPFVTKHKGHFAYSNKKITPVGHWIGMLGIFARQTNASDHKAALAYAITSMAIFDGFIACWEQKYRTLTVRPITVIRANWESEWESLLQTPPFPEYTSGHSVISSAAATTASAIYGDTLSFHDTTEVRYLNLSRRFRSIRQAADEAGISRLYGGIHFRSALEQGKKQGNRVGELYLRFLSY